VGGSTAFGQLSSSNQATFAAKLEARLNQQVKAQIENPGKFRPDVLPYFADEVARVMNLPPRIQPARYRVINAAVPGYSSGNEFMQVAMQVLPYKPDLVVLMNGYPDLLLPSSVEASEVAGSQAMLQNAPKHLWSSLSLQLGGFFGQLYLVKGFQYWVLRSHSSAQNYLIPPLDVQGSSLTAAINVDDKELKQRVERYRANLQMIARFTANAKVPLIVALQPELTGRNPKTLTPAEQQLLEQLGPNYRQKVQAGYGLLQQSVKQVQQNFSGNVSSLNLYQFYANTNFKGQAFQDPIHLTDAGNAKLADGLYNTIAGRLTIQARPFTGNAPPAR
jgi:lysophospholipase L1-like esterase